MSDSLEQTFLNAIHENPEDESLRRVYLDWLEEEGSPRAEYFRLMDEKEKVESNLTQVNEELEKLVPEVGKGWIRSLFRQKEPGRFRLHCGYEIRMVSLKQDFTYAGLLEGVPTQEMNQSIIDSLLNKYSDAAPHLIPPDTQPINLHRSTPYPFGTPEKIPGVTCVSRLESLETVEDSTMDCSVLTLIWFQAELGLPTNPQVKEKILDLDWKNLAEDWQY